MPGRLSVRALSLPLPLPLPCCFASFLAASPRLRVRERPDRPCEGSTVLRVSPTKATPLGRRPAPRSRPDTVQRPRSAARPATVQKTAPSSVNSAKIGECPSPRLASESGAANFAARLRPYAPISSVESGAYWPARARARSLGTKTAHSALLLCHQLANLGRREHVIGGQNGDGTRKRGERREKRERLVERERTAVAGRVLLGSSFCLHQSNGRTDGRIGLLAGPVEKGGGGGGKQL